MEVNLICRSIQDILLHNSSRWLSTWISSLPALAFQSSICPKYLGLSTSYLPDTQSLSLIWSYSFPYLYHASGYCLSTSIFQDGILFELCVSSILNQCCTCFLHHTQIHALQPEYKICFTNASLQGPQNNDPVSSWLLKTWLNSYCVLT